MPKSISDVLWELEPGAHVTFDSGHGSIEVVRSTLPTLNGGSSFTVSGVTSAKAGLTASEAQADVARRRQIRDRAKVARANRQSGLAP